MAGGIKVVMEPAFIAVDVIGGVSRSSGVVDEWNHVSMFGRGAQAMHDSGMSKSQIAGAVAKEAGLNVVTLGGRGSYLVGNQIGENLIHLQDNEAAELSGEWTMTVLMGAKPAAEGYNAGFNAAKNQYSRFKVRFKAKPSVLPTTTQNARSVVQYESPIGPEPIATKSAVQTADNVGVMESRLRRLGYDEANTNRVIQSIQNGDQVVVVGENMKRVNAVAGMVDSAGGNSITYEPRNWSGLNRNSLEANRSWIRYWAKDMGVTIIDIGRQPTMRPQGPSPFYGIENRSLIRWEIYTPFN